MGVWKRPEQSDRHAKQRRLAGWYAEGAASLQGSPAIQSGMDAGLVEHAADAGPVDMRGFDAESDDTTRKHVHDDHHPETLQVDGLAAKKIDAAQAVTGFSTGTAGTAQTAQPANPVMASRTNTAGCTS
jgi:hypothetical protein